MPFSSTAIIAAADNENEQQQQQTQTKIILNPLKNVNERIKVQSKQIYTKFTMGEEREPPKITTR